jgi:hypothetical protein
MSPEQIAQKREEIADRGRRNLQVFAQERREAEAARQTRNDAPVSRDARCTNDFNPSEDDRAALYAGVSPALLDDYTTLINADTLPAYGSAADRGCMFWEPLRRGRMGVTDVRLVDGTVGSTSASRLTWALTRSLPVLEEGQPVGHVCKGEHVMDGVRHPCVNPIHLKKK